MGEATDGGGRDPFFIQLLRGYILFLHGFVSCMERLVSLSLRETFFTALERRFMDVNQRGVVASNRRQLHIQVRQFLAGLYASPL